MGIIAPDRYNANAVPSVKLEIQVKLLSNVIMTNIGSKCNI